MRTVRSPACLLGLLAITAAGSIRALGQDADALAELTRLHERLAESRAVLSVEDGRAALAQLERWGWQPADLPADARGAWLRTSVYAALAMGDAKRAADALALLQQDGKDATDTLRAAWSVAVAAGDAQLAKEMLAVLGDRKLARAKAIERRLRRLERVGHPAPDTTAKTSLGRDVALRKRFGVALVLDFWTTAQPPDDSDVAATKALYQSVARDPKIEFLGVNSDPPAKLDEARKFVASAGLAWPQHYEEAAGAPPLTAGAFGVESQPWQVLIDAEGNVRAVGTAGEPEFVYAVRAALAEARGDYAVVRPKTTAGVVATPTEYELPAVAQGETRPPAAEEEDLPHNPDAQRLLDEARTFLKTGMKKKARELLERIVREYPGTWEARDAQRRLSYL